MKKTYLSWKEFQKEMILDYQALEYFFFKIDKRYEKKPYLSWKEFDKIFYSTALDCLKNNPFIPRLQTVKKTKQNKKTYLSWKFKKEMILDSMLKIV